MAWLRPAVTARVVIQVLEDWDDEELLAALGEANVLEGRPEMVSEDFGFFGLENRAIPVFMFRLGDTDPARLQESERSGKPMPSLHSSLYYPDAETAIRTGVTATMAAVLELLKK